MHAPPCRSPKGRTGAPSSGEPLSPDSGKDRNPRPGAGREQGWQSRGQQHAEGGRGRGARRHTVHLPSETGYSRADHGDAQRSVTRMSEQSHLRGHLGRHPSSATRETGCGLWGGGGSKGRTRNPKPGHISPRIITSHETRIEAHGRGPQIPTGPPASPIPASA